jgi:hypothetical protein
MLALEDEFDIVKIVEQYLQKLIYNMYFYRSNCDIRTLQIKFPRLQNGCF